MERKGQATVQTNTVTYRRKSIPDRGDLNLAQDAVLGIPTRSGEVP
jgi:hypothetical protein